MTMITKATRAALVAVWGLARAVPAMADGLTVQPVTEDVWAIVGPLD